MQEGIDGKGGIPGGQCGGPPGKPGLIKTLKQAGPDNRGDVHAPLANEPDTSSGRIARRHGGSDTEGTSPTHAYSHDPFVYGELKEWLDGLAAGRKLNGLEWLDGPELPELASWVRRVGKGGKARFKEVTGALQKEGFGDLWLMLMTSDEASEACRQMDP